MASLCTTSLDEFAPLAVPADTPAFSLYASAQTLARIGAGTQDRSRGYSRDVIVEKRAPGDGEFLVGRLLGYRTSSFRVESPEVRMNPRVPYLSRRPPAGQPARPDPAAFRA